MRFEQFNDDELYMLKRAMIEAQKRIYEFGPNYEDKELEMLNNLLNEAIENSNQRYIERMKER